jgi:Ca-activated chloride channel family protein
MSRTYPLCALIVAAGMTAACCAPAQTESDNGPRSNLRLSVDEVSFVFHAEDSHGVSVDDLKSSELVLRDNGKPPARIVAFELLQDEPIRAGFLLDTSSSMASRLPASRQIAANLAQKVLRTPADQAFVMDFGYTSQIAQPWTSDTVELTKGLRAVVSGRQNPLGGTALFDTVFRACFNLFGKLDDPSDKLAHVSGGNLILLLSDGEDNESHTSLAEAVDMCQRSNTAIYAFRAEPSPSLFSEGPKTLADLASQTGGRVFAGNGAPEEIDSDLRIIETDLRNQYRLIYNPVALRHDGAFHRIELKAPGRVAHVTIRTGYYDRAR